MIQEGIQLINIKKVHSGGFEDVQDSLAIEEPLEIQLHYRENGIEQAKSVSVTMRTPGNDVALSLGFLFTEGILTNADQVAATSGPPEAENKICVVLKEGFVPQLNSAERNFYTTSSCGVCGKASIDAIKTVSVFEKNTDEIRLHPDVLHVLPLKLRQQQAVFDSTGGLHASALFDFEGNFLALQEDVGRHNALDKVIGNAFLSGRLPLSHNILLLSGRASFELVQKAEMAGIKIIAAVGAPSSLAVSLARENDMTLIGFLRENRFNIYSGAHRVIY